MASEPPDDRGSPEGAGSRPGWRHELEVAGVGHEPAVARREPPAAEDLDEPGVLDRLQPRRVAAEPHVERDAPGVARHAVAAGDEAGIEAAVVPGLLDEARQARPLDLREGSGQRLDDAPVAANGAEDRNAARDDVLGLPSGVLFEPASAPGPVAELAEPGLD